MSQITISPLIIRFTYTIFEKARSIMDKSFAAFNSVSSPLTLSSLGAGKVRVRVLVDTEKDG